MVRNPSAAAGLFPAALAAAVLAQDRLLQLSPGEVHISSHPYQPAVATIHSEARWVEVEAVVRDSQGKPVRGLSRDDFEVLDSGKKREVVAFSVETAAQADAEAVAQKQIPSNSSSAAVSPTSSEPVARASQAATPRRSIALFFDDVNTPAADLARAQIAASRFIKEELSPGDGVAIFDTSAGEVERFTSDVNGLISAVRQLQSHPRASAGGFGTCPRITPYQAYRIASMDPSALQAAVLEECKCPGRDATECMGVDGMPAYQLSSSMAGGGDVAGEKMGGYAEGIGQIVADVKAQASATWFQAKLVSDGVFAAIGACLQSLATMPGKRMLLLASSGFISGESGPQEDAVVQQALRAGVVINAIDAKGLYAEAPVRPLDEPSAASELHPLSMVYEASSLGDRLESQDAAVARLTESTGGLFFRNNNDLNLGFYQLGVIPEVAYLAAFPPAEDGRYHKLRVQLKSKASGFVQARPGYFAPAGATTGQPSQAEALDRAVAGNDESNAVLAALTLQLGKTAANGRRLSLNIHVDARGLPFQHQKDLHVEKLTFVAALYDLQGRFIAGKEAEMDLGLKPETYEGFMASGITGTLSLDASPGYYSLRTVVQEGVQGKITSETKQVHVE